MAPLTDDAAPPPPPRDACEHAVVQLWDYLDGRLADVDRERVAAHLAVCADCTSHFAFEQSFLDAVRTLRRADDGFGALRARVVDALRRDRAPADDAER